MRKIAHDIKFDKENTDPNALKMHHHHDSERYEMPTEEELKGSGILESDLDRIQRAVMTDKTTGIKQLQKILDAFPWEDLNKQKPKLMPPTGKIDANTQQAINLLTEVAQTYKEPNLIKMLAYIEQGDFFNAQSVAYVAKTMISKALHQFRKMPAISPEMLEKYPGLRRWTKAEMFSYLKTSPYAAAGYFPPPWDLSRLGRRGYDGSFGCDPSKQKCDISYYENFMKWRAPQGTMGGGLAYDPRFYRNMDKYPNIWSNRAIKFRMKHNIPSPHIPSPGTGAWMDVNNLPKGKGFLDKEDKNEYFRLLKLYNQFVKEEQSRETSYIAPPANIDTPVIASITSLADYLSGKYRF